MRALRRDSGSLLLQGVISLAVAGALAAMLAGVLGSSLGHADRIKAAANMRGLGAAVLAFSADSNGRLPGPLWPGQVAEYDRDRPGRLVVDLASYLDVAARSQPYVVGRLLTASHRKAAPGVAPKDLRYVVMNMSLKTPGGSVNPWGSLAAPPSQPSTLSQISAAHRDGGPGFSEADRTHPDVASAPWAAFTASHPPHGSPRLCWYFDGSVSAARE